MSTAIIACVFVVLIYGSLLAYYRVRTPFLGMRVRHQFRRDTGVVVDRFNSRYTVRWDRPNIAPEALEQVYGSALEGLAPWE